MVGGELSMNYVLSDCVDQSSFVDLSDFLRLDARIGIGGKSSPHIKFIEDGILIKHIKNKVVHHALLPVIRLPWVQVLSIMQIISLNIVQG